jgi:hypothetical protein
MSLERIEGNDNKGFSERPQQFGLQKTYYKSHSLGPICSLRKRKFLLQMCFCLKWEVIYPQSDYLVPMRIHAQNHELAPQYMFLTVIYIEFELICCCNEIWVINSDNIFEK